MDFLEKRNRLINALILARKSPEDAIWDESWEAVASELDSEYWFHLQVPQSLANSEPLRAQLAAESHGDSFEAEHVGHE